MAVPGFESLMLPVLKFLSDGKIRRSAEIYDPIATQLGISVEDQAIMLPSGAMSRYRNRVLWALHHMKRAGVVASPSRGHYVISDRGRNILAESPSLLNMKALEQFQEYREFRGGGRLKPETTTVVIDDIEASTPEERLQAAYEEMQNHVAADILDRLRAVDPLRFEGIVLEVLTAMGYGGSDPERATLTAYSHDGGLDGVIKEDPLGLDRVVVQAKRHTSAVDVKHIREFAGSLDEHGTNKGVFFTTDRFTGPAQEYVKSIKKRIILIDGPELARLMVIHRVGVSVVRELRIVRVDSDFFEDTGI